MSTDAASIDAYRVNRTRRFSRAICRFGEKYRDIRPPMLAVYAVRAARYATWHRTWQAEWDGCQRAPRAFTKAGVLRKARRRV